MTNYFLITRPDYDGPTSYLYHWSKASLERAREHGLQVINVEGSEATRAKVESYLKNAGLNIPLLVFNGHGDEDSIRGHQNEVLIGLGTNEALLEGRITYSIACGAAKHLGPAAVKNGGTYIGYIRDFRFYHDQDKASRPLQDEIAGLYLEHYRVLVAALLKGNKTGDAYQKARKSLLDSLKASLTGKDTYLASALFADYKNFVLLGDQEASV